MVTPRNVLVPPLWHFILFHHLLLSTFSISPHRNYPDYDYSCDDNDNCSKIALPRSYPTLRRLWLTERMSANVSPLVFFMLSMFLSFISFLSYLVFCTFVLLPLISLHFSAHLLCPFSPFQFSATLSSRLLCSFQPFLVHLTAATCLSSPSLFFESLFVHSFSSATEDQD